MGTIRSLPQNEVIVTSQNEQNLYYVSAAVCGWQYYMQDFQIKIVDKKIKLFAIIDGHNGSEVAELFQKKLPELFHANDLIMNMGQILMGLQNIICELEQLIYNCHAEVNQIRSKHNLPILDQQQRTRSGCSFVLAAINDQQIIIGNIGLCRCYVVYKKDQSKAILFSGNHICSNKQQQSRILKNNGFVYGGKVNGIYPFTRSIGDFHMKKNIVNGKYRKQKLNEGIITSQPSFFSLRRQDIGGIFLGSSGLWQKPDIVGISLSQLGKSKQKDEQKLQQLISALVASQPSQQKFGLQNMTAIYINLKQ